MEEKKIEEELKKEKELLEKEKHEIEKIEEELQLNIAGRLARDFLKNPLTFVIGIVLLLFGLIAILFTPREENPQIDVPSANVIVVYPGASAKEVQNIIVEPLSRKLNEMTNVDHIYGMAMNSVGVVTVVFEIGQNKEKSISKLYDRVMQNMNLLPKGAWQPLVKPIDIDEVPILTFAIASKKYNDAQLYRIAQRLLTPLAEVDNVSVVGIKGGHKRQFNVIISAEKLAAYHLSLGQVADALQKGNVDYPLGNFENGQFSIPVEYNGFIRTLDDVRNLLVANYQGRPIYLKDIAIITDTANYQDKHFTYFIAGQSFENPNIRGERLNQVTVYVAKKRGTNAVFVAKDAIKKIEELKKLLPSDIEVVLTRNDGHKANEAVNELFFHLFISLIIIFFLLWGMLGLREAGIVLFTVPLILAVTLFIGMLAGQTINRITLFALILSLGLLVDSAIVVIENIHRHFSMGDKSKEHASVYATNEIGNPTNIATLAIILAFVPMFFVGGMMGPYMAPIPFNVPVAMIASLVVAYIFTPWAAFKFLPDHHDHEPFDIKKTKIYAVFDKLLRPMIESRAKRGAFIFSLVLLTIGAIMLMPTKVVLFKMLPGANKNTFNITIDLPTGSSIETTKEVVAKLEERLKKEKNIKDFESFIGMGGVIDFNGLLRGSSLKKGDNLAEIRVNLKDKNEREESSIDLVSRLRPSLQEIGKPYNANIKLVEDPPGPPVIATLLMEVSGGSKDGRLILAKKIEELYKHTEGVVDVDVMADDSIVKYEIIPDKVKAGLLGITTKQIADILGMGIKGAVIGVTHIPSEKEQVGIFVRFDKNSRSSIKDLEKIKIMSMTTHRMVPLSEVVKIRPVPFGGMITSKDLREIVMVTGEMDKRGSIYALLDIFFYLKDKGLNGYTITYDGNPRLNLVAINNKTGEKFNLVWDGEWKITFDTFRDLGSAFGGAVVLIFLLMVAYYKNFRIPRIVLAAVPLTFIGVLPGHWITSLFTIPLQGTPAYFTATSMIGFIALAGIVVRNSLLLIDFTNDLLRQGRSLNDAVVEAAATRFRPIILTALAIILASSVIVLDPVWQGLAVSLIFGVMVSTILSLFVIPVLYWRYLRDNPDAINSEKGVDYGLEAE
jgi:multidrug efflux pump subunit AcrB